MQTIRQPTPLTPGYRLQNWYEIGRVLGRGNFGITYQAHDCNLERNVAIKEYLPSALAVRDSGVFVQPADSHNEETYHIGVEAFLSEARILAKLDHPNVPSIINVFVAHNTAYMVMGFEEGETLEAVLQRRKTLEEAKLLQLLTPLLGALERLHEIPHIHGDLTPAHILIRADGSPVLLDFGGTRRVVSQLMRSPHASPGYSALEIHFGKKDQIGPPADIYALAAVLYRAVTGITPPDALERRRIMLNESRDPLMPCTQIRGPRYSETLRRAIDSGLKLDREERPQTIAAWRREFGSSSVGTLDGMRLRADAESGTAASARHLRRGRDGRGPRAGTITGGLLGAALLALAADTWFHRGAEISPPESIPAPPAASPSPQNGASPPVTPAPVPTPPPAAEKSHEAPVTAPRVTQEELLKAKVLALISAARDDMDAGRLLNPADDNAVAKFRAVLALSPDNEEAQQGLQRIAEGLIAKSQETARRRDFAKAQTYLDQAGSVLPGLEKLAAARKELHAQMLEASQPEQSPKPTDTAAQAIHLATAARGAITRKQWQTAEMNINKIAALMPQFEELPQLRQDLAEARQQQPPAAPPTQGEVSPSSTTQELQTHLKLARRALQRHQLDKAEVYVDKAAALAPDSESVAALQIELFAAREAAATSAIPPPDSAPDATPPPAEVAIRDARVSLPVASPGQTIEFETEFVLGLPQNEKERQVTATWALIHNGHRIGKQGEASMPLRAGVHTTQTDLTLPASMKPGTYVVEHRIGVGNSQDVARSSFQVKHP